MKKSINPYSTMLSGAIVGGAGMSLPPGAVNPPSEMGVLLLYVPLQSFRGKSPIEMQVDLGLPWCGPEGEPYWFDQNRTDEDTDDLWVGRAQALFNAFRGHITEVSELTAGKVLQVVADKRLSARDRSPMIEVLHVLPGYRPQSVGDGLFPALFVEQLELLCENIRVIEARGLLKK